MFGVSDQERSFRQMYLRATKHCSRGPMANRHATNARPRRGWRPAQERTRNIRQVQIGRWRRKKRTNHNTTRRPTMVAFGKRPRRPRSYGAQCAAGDGQFAERSHEPRYHNAAAYQLRYGPYQSFVFRLDAQVSAILRLYARTVCRT